MIHDYALFAKVVEAGSLSGAARHLRISTGMVSKRLAAMELRLGAKLIHRTTRRLSLTDIGQQFHAKLLIARAAEVEAENVVAERIGAPAGTLRISSAVLTGRMHISRQLPAFLRAYPGVTVELALTDDFVDLQSGRADLAIRITGMIEPHLTGHLLAPNHRILCAAPEYLARCGRPGSVADLSRHALLGASAQFPWRLDGPEGTRMVHGDSLVRTNASEVVRDLLLGGLGIALRSPWDVTTELASGAVVRILPEYEGTTGMGIYAVHRRDAFVPAAVTAFIDHIRPVFAALPLQTGAMRIAAAMAALP